MKKHEPCTIPHVVHFVYGLKENAPFGLQQYLALRSAWDVHRPTKLWVHYTHLPRPEPNGSHWWHEAKKFATLRHVLPPTSIWGRPLLHYAHQSDVLRLQVVERWGGIYLDMDSISVRPLPPELRAQSALLGIQDTPRGGTTREHARWYGLCNAIFAAEPGAPFIKQWLEEYRSFNSSGRDGQWDLLSVRRPADMYDERCPNDRCPAVHGGQCELLRALPSQAFFPVGWAHVEKAMFDASRWSWGARALRRSYAIHLWSQGTMPGWVDRLRTLDAARDWFRGSLYGEFAQRHVQLRAQGFRSDPPLYSPRPLRNHTPARHDEGFSLAHTLSSGLNLPDLPDTSSAALLAIAWLCVWLWSCVMMCAVSELKSRLARK